MTTEHLEIRPSKLELLIRGIRYVGDFNKPDGEVLKNALPESWETWKFPKPTTILGKIRGVVDGIRRRN